MKKKLFIILCLSAGFQLNSNWYVPKEGNKADFDTDTEHLLDIFYGNDSQDSRYEVSNNAQVVEICNKTQNRPGCTDKNRHGQVFCESYKGGDLLGNCLKRDWSDWEKERHWVQGGSKHTYTHGACSDLCGIAGKTWSQGLVTIGDQILCNCNT